MKRIKFTRQLNDKGHGVWMRIALAIVVIVPFILGIGLYLKSAALFNNQTLFQLITSSDWKPMGGKFGFLPFILSSLWITLLSILIAGPICLLTAIHLTQYARKGFLKIMHPVIDILAGIPSVIYGVWGIIVIVPFVSEYLAPFCNTTSDGYSIITGSIVLAVMIIPFILNILIEVFHNIPRELTEASLSLGATYWETIKFVLLKKGLPGIISAFSLGISRAFGETIAVLMVVGNLAQIPHSIFKAGYPLPALIANNYGEMMSIPLYDSALMFAALILFVVVLVFNLLSRLLIIRFEKQV